jgi:hypothetical protein
MVELKVVMKGEKRVAKLADHWVVELVEMLAASSVDLSVFLMAV